MTAQETIQPVASSSTEPHRMRITSGGSIASYLKFSLNFLQNNPHRSLVLHTLPPEPKDALESDVLDTNAAASSSILTPATLTTPKLISVVELIKRTFLEIENGDVGKGKATAKGIWQYTESGLLPISTKPTSGAEGLARVLSGKTKPKMTHRPYLQITLSTRPLGLEDDPKTCVTCQYTLVRKRKAGAHVDGGQDVATSGKSGKRKKSKGKKVPGSSAASKAANTDGARVVKLKAAASGTGVKRKAIDGSQSSQATGPTNAKKKAKK